MDYYPVRADLSGSAVQCLERSRWGTKWYSLAKGHKESKQSLPHVVGYRKLFLTDGQSLRVTEAEGGGSQGWVAAGLSYTYFTLLNSLIRKGAFH